MVSESRSGCQFFWAMPNDTACEFNNGNVPVYWSVTNGFTNYCDVPPNTVFSVSDCAIHLGVQYSGNVFYSVWMVLRTMVSPQHWFFSDCAIHWEFNNGNVFYSVWMVLLTMVSPQHWVFSDCAIHWEFNNGNVLYSVWMVLLTMVSPQHWFFSECAIHWEFNNGSLSFEQECHSRSKGQCPCIPWVYVLQTVSVCFVDSPYCYKHCSPRVYQRPFPSPNHAIHSLYWRSVTLWLNVLSSCQWCAIDDWETFMPHMAMFTEMVFTLVMVAVKTILCL